MVHIFLLVTDNKKYFCTIHFHAYVQYVYIVYVRYWIYSANVVVGVYQLIKALSMSGFPQKFKNKIP